jgi:hypothetical protein
LGRRQRQTWRVFDAELVSAALVRHVELNNRDFTVRGWRAIALSFAGDEQRFLLIKGNKTEWVAKGDVTFP